VTWAWWASAAVVALGGYAVGYRVGTARARTTAQAELLREQLALAQLAESALATVEKLARYDDAAANERARTMNEILDARRTGWRGD
jgi:hypothetical protein